MKKGCIIAAIIGFVALLVLAGIGFLAYLGISGLTAPMAAEGEKFLSTLGSGSAEVAYAMTSATFQQGQTEEEFVRTVKGFGLDGFQSASWSNRKIENDRGTLDGTAHCKSGGSVPLTLEMIKEGGTWKVLSIKGPQTGASTGPIIQNETAAPPAPTAAAAAKMAMVSLMAFNEAIQAKSFDKFHAGISDLWQKQITPAKLLEVFQPFINAKIDLADIQPLSPVFKSPPAVDSDGVLVLEGEYPTTPNKVTFRLKYVTEDKTWKLLGVKVNVGD